MRNPIRFSETPADYRLPPPSLDQHGEEIRQWLAGPVDRTTDEESLLRELDDREGQDGPGDGDEAA